MKLFKQKESKAAESSLRRTRSTARRRELRDADASKIEPDARTKRAVSKKEAPLDRLKRSISAHIKLMIASVLVVFLVGAFYTPLKYYYHARRDVEIRQQVLDQLNQQNADYQTEIARLQSEEGIKDEARERGYVEKGEVSVEVEDPAQSKKDVLSQKSNDPNKDLGKDFNKDSDKSSDKNTGKDQKSGGSQTGDKATSKKVQTAHDFKITTKWYENILDKIFFYQPPVFKQE